MAQRDVLAAKVCGEVFPSTGMFGSGGLGKTTFARALALALGYYFWEIEGAAIKDRKTFIKLLVEVSANAYAANKTLMLFCDEAHRLGAQQEVLYMALTDWKITTVEGDIKFRPFTFVAATTHPHMLFSPLLTRLQNKWFFEPYNETTMRSIVAAKLSEYKLDYDFLIVERIAKRCLGNPRIANNLCKKVRNTVLARGSRKITDHDCFATFALEGIDELGLERIHVRYLIELFNADGSPKGKGMIAGRLGIDEDVLTGSVEPQLLQLGLIDLTGRGRILTKSGHAHLLQSGAVGS